MKIRKTWSQEKYIRAIRFAGAAHAGQKIPGTDLPYVIHLASVCMEILFAISEEGAENPDLAVQCALLHDAIEDAGIKYDDLKNTFGADVAMGVLALTKDENLEKNLRMKDSIERIKLQPREIWMVKLADRITNLMPPPPLWTPEKIAGYRSEAEYILKKLGEASPALGKRLKKKIGTYP